MKLLNKIFTALRLKHSKQQALQLPATERRPKHQPELLPDNIVTTRTGIFKVTTSEDSAQWERVQDHKQASLQELTEAELQKLQEKNLNRDLVRASEFKRLWCSGCSAADAAKAAGFSTRTLEKYWAVFNAEKTRNFGK